MKLYYSLFILIGFLFSACSEDTAIIGPDPFFTSQETFQVPLFIEVYTQDGLRVSNAKVTLGASEGYTDEGGLLYFNNVTVGQSAYLIVEKEGYFQASRRFYPTSGNAQFLKIIMLSNSRIAFFNAKDGAVLPVEEKATIHFPADGYVLVNGEAYNGIVVIAAKPIAADDPDLSFKMPGDLIGVNGSGKTGVLGSLGMIAIEMKTPSGDKIEFKKGVEATLEMIIPPSMADKAPAIIPLWYFDEYAGIWKEEGVAEKSGDRYIGKVGHFSFWNCDDFFESVTWGASFSYEDGSPASQTKVCITIESLGAMSCAFTDANGVVRGIVAANEFLDLKVLGLCELEIYSSVIGPLQNETFLGPVAIPETGLIHVNVSGNTMNCHNSPVVNGYARISFGAGVFFTALDKLTGAFNSKVQNCIEEDIQIEIVDASSGKISIPQIYAYAPVVNADTISVCSINPEFLDLEVVGFPEHYYFFYPSQYISEGQTTIYQQSTLNGDADFLIGFYGDTTGMYIVDPAIINVTLPNGRQVFAVGSLLSAEITRFGEVGDYIVGTLSGTWFSDPGNSNYVEYPLRGSFSVLREE